MSVLSYLQARASQAVLSDQEKVSIQRSIAALKDRAAMHFNVELAQQLPFGSFTRGTILPRSMDAQSDIDYLLQFTDTLSKPQTHLDRIRRFIEKYYNTSQIRQSNPTIILELNHIRFELVPAIQTWLTGLQIPAPARSYAEWMGTDPNGFNAHLEAQNQSNRSLLKPAIRLAKYWNAQNDYVFPSFLFEQWIASQWFWGCANLKDYLFAIFDGLTTTADMAQWRRDKLQRARQIVMNVRALELQSNFLVAEMEIKKLIP